MLPEGPELNPANLILAALPILVLMAGILWWRWSGPRAGAVSWIVVVLVALIFFGADERIVAIGSAKGLSLSLFVLTIIWSSVLLYNMLEQQGCIKIIGLSMTRMVGDPLAQALIIGWAFSGFMQGIAGFGVPVVVVAPLLVMMGFTPARAAAIVLVGHAWSVTFGSLGSSYYTIQLVTGIDGSVLGPYMAAVFALPTILTGFAVAHLQGGRASVLRGTPAILVMGGAMSLGVWVIASVGSPQVAAMLSGLIGCGVGWLVIRSRLMPCRQKSAVSSSETIRSSPKQSNGPSFHLAFLPYYLLITFSILSQIPEIKTMGSTWYLGVDYPSIVTKLGFSVDAEEGYARIGLLRHPAPMIILSLILTMGVYRIIGTWKSGSARTAYMRTYAQCVPTSVGVATMVMVALVMTNVGMTSLLGQSIAYGTGPLFVIFSPYIGVLGTFMTGSNTNSNILFGALQAETANTLGISAVMVASVQSIGGSLGSAIAPAKVLVGAAIVGLGGREGEVLRRTIPYCLAIVLMVGLEAWVVLYVYSMR